MYGSGEGSSRRRATGALVSLGANGAIIAGLIWGLGIAAPQGPPAEPALTTLEFRPPPPPPDSSDETAEASPREEGASAPKAAALPVEAPAAAIPLAPAPAAPVAGEGRETDAGAARQGVGTGSGSQGSGGGGGGTGAGGGSPAVRIAGALRDSDYPREAEAEGLAGTVAISFRVRTDGRVDRCSVERSSGHALIDDLTCRLLTQRYRFRPATDAAGKPIESVLRTSFTWGTRRRR